MERFAQLCEAVNATASRNEKVRLVAEFLSGTPPEDLAIAATFCSGRALPVAAGALRLGGSQIIHAAARVLVFSDKALARAYDRHGDLGGALAELMHAGPQRGLFQAPVSLGRVAQSFARIASLAGPGATRKRESEFAQLLADATPLEAKYLVKLITGDLRIGFKEALVVDALALAFGRGHGEVRRALMASGDIGEVARLAREDRLPHATVAYARPIGFMLASPIAYGGGYTELDAGGYFVEDKFDGIRAQAHVKGGIPSLFSRRLNDVTISYPEVAESLRRCQTDCILDGELLAWRDGRALPFQALQTRLSRIAPEPALLEQVPVAFVAFDLLAEGGEFLIDVSLLERRRRLEALPVFDDHLVLSGGSWIDVQSPPTAAQGAAIEALFQAARERGNEGLMLKAADSAYLPGRRGRQWFKLKRELVTLDCVVVAVEYGHGKRNNVLSDYTFAVRDGERLLTVGKAYSGLTDAEIAEKTEWFLAHTLGRRGRRFVVAPEIVVEIAFDIVQPSPLHESGFALRFPRIARLRPDKSPAEASTLDEVRALAQQ
ncbi:MAG TPA: ATP-dependent DNA ligase [Candidatus Eremiobacteraceae bacterium]|nr:ATP-dependent DNA ligase [Candidatus Eremiobacteraceae bacterium]